MEASEIVRKIMRETSIQLNYYQETDLCDMLTLAIQEIRDTQHEDTKQAVMKAYEVHSHLTSEILDNIDLSTSEED